MLQQITNMFPTTITNDTNEYLTVPTLEFFDEKNLCKEINTPSIMKRMSIYQNLNVSLH
jgi:hypothetical protein